MRTLIASAIVLSLAAGTADAQMKVQTNTPKGTSTAITPAPSQQSLDAARRIDRETAMELDSDGKIVYVDVRSTESYNQGHIKGAISIPLSVLRGATAEAIRRIPPGKMVVTYCACQAEHTAAIAVLHLNQYGFKNAAALLGGWNEWKAMRGPIEMAKK